MDNKQHQSIRVFTHRAFAVFITLLLISEARTAYAGEGLQKIAQQGKTSQQNTTGSEAIKLTKEGLELFKKGTPESLIAARKKFESALILWRKLENKEAEAQIIAFIAQIYSDLGETQKALQYNKQALPLYRALGDKRQEAVTLNNIAGAYNNLGEKHKALQFLKQALPLRRAVDDKGGEAVTLNNIGQIYSDLG